MPGLCSNCKNIDFSTLTPMPRGSTLFPYDAKMNPKLPGGGLFKLNHALPSLGQFHSTYKDIYENGEIMECPLCELMWKACHQFRNNLSSDDSYRAQYKHQLNNFRVYLAMSDKYSKGFTYWTDSDQPKYAFLIGEIGLVTQQSDNLHATIWGREIPENPKTSLPWFSAMIARCDTQHHEAPLNNAISGNTILPQRVIFVRNGKVLLQTPPPNTKGKYITLSYRWPEQRITSAQYVALGATLNSNYTLRNNTGLDLTSSLNETYLDAVDIARQLNIDYLWIDALCIIQDDQADKNLQIRRMGEIYQNSYLTVCASDGLRPYAVHDSISRPQVPEYHKFQMKVDGILGYPEAFEVPYDDVIAGNQVQNFSKEIVSNRGWTFQERVLSPRTMFFGSTQVYLECNTWCIGRDGFECPGRRLKAEEIPSGVNFREYWWSLVAMYCTRDLGVESDKLVAIGGLAKVLKSACGVSTEYVAGLWTGPRFLGDLLWSSTADQEDKLDWDTREYRAPSWSWAAVDGQVSPPVHEYRSCDEVATLVEGPDVIPKDSLNEYGEVNEGLVKIYGPQIKARVFQKLDPVRLGDGTKGPGDSYKLVTAAGTVLSRGAFIDYNVFIDELQNWDLHLLIIGKITVNGELIYPALILFDDGTADDRVIRVGTVDITRSDLRHQSLDDNPEVKYRQYQIA